MTNAALQDKLLDEIRRDIDHIDDAIVDLLARRIAAAERVRNHKFPTGGNAPSPIRPAREAAILRRLLARAGDAVPADLLVRLWRVILTSSTLAQAPVTLHIAKKLNQSPALRLKLRDHFGPMPVEEHRDDAQALTQVNIGMGDICAVETGAAWANAFCDGKSGEARVMAVLPAIGEGEPEILIFGHGQPQVTEDDETLVVTTGRLPRDFQPVPNWQRASGKHWVSGLPGFLSEHESPLISLVRSNTGLGLRIAGRYPRPIRVAS
ncbi:MAG: hypothetical protein FJX63_00195 [Alphaproteobacteria bacterium]|nr:hypothetical protein [Alphaproteobacteria bacterium]